MIDIDKALLVFEKKDPSVVEEESQETETPSEESDEKE